MSFWNFFFLFFIFIPLAVLWFRTIFDIFDRADLNGAKKTLWIFAVIALPLLGTLIYLFTRPVTEQDRERAGRIQVAIDEAQAQHRQLAGFSVADELEKLERLRTDGVVSQDEFDRVRARLLT